MSMHILPAYFSTTRNSKTKKKVATVSAHEKWLGSKGLTLSQIKAKKKVDSNWKKEYNDSLKVDRSDYVSHGLSGSPSSTAKRGVMTNLHKEEKQVQEAILQKANRTAPAYSKGSYQYITLDTDLSDIGKKK